jgi:hypothetical protein
LFTYQRNKRRRRKKKKKIFFKKRKAKKTVAGIVQLTLLSNNYTSDAILQCGNWRK